MPNDNEVNDFKATLKDMESSEIQTEIDRQTWGLNSWKLNIAKSTIADRKNEENLKLGENANKIAEQSNKIANDANRHSKLANILSLLALLASATAILISFLK